MASTFEVIEILNNENIAIQKGKRQIIVHKNNKKKKDKQLEKNK